MRLLITLQIVHVQAGRNGEVGTPGVSIGLTRRRLLYSHYRDLTKHMESNTMPIGMLLENPKHIAIPQVSALAHRLKLGRLESELSKTNSIAIALVAAEFYRGIDLTDWCHGKHESHVDLSSQIINNPALDRRVLDKTFALWGIEARANLLSFLQEKRSDIAGLFNELCEASFDAAEKKPLGWWMNTLFNRIYIIRHYMKQYEAG